MTKEKEETSGNSKVYQKIISETILEEDDDIVSNVPGYDFILAIMILITVPITRIMRKELRKNS